MQVIVYMRDTFDWGNLTKEKYLQLNKANPYHVSSFRFAKWFYKKRIKLWNDSFDIPYFQYRQQLKDITLTNLKKANLKVVTSFNQISEKNFILLFIDDDDWFRSDISEVLKKADFEKGVIWDRCVFSNKLEYRKINYRPSVIPTGDIKDLVCFTNNYAITDKLFREVKDYEFIQHHGKMDLIFKQDPMPKINDYLSVKNRHLGSITSLTKCLTHGDLLNNYEKYMDGLSSCGDVLETAQMVEIYNKLRGKNLLLI